MTEECGTPEMTVLPEQVPVDKQVRLVIQRCGTSHPHVPNDRWYDVHVSHDVDTADIEEFEKVADHMFAMLPLFRHDNPGHTYRLVLRDERVMG